MSEFRFFAYTDFEYHTNRSENILNLPIVPFHPTKLTTTDEISHELNIPYTVFEILVATFAIIGNLMVIIVFQRERKLRRRTNFYIVSLAIADFLVGSLGVPFAIMASIGMPTNLYACLFTVSLLVVLCTISIFCLVAVSVDRYWAILYPMAYSRNVRTRTAIVIISMCWAAGAVVGFLPLFGWHAEVGPNQACLFVEVMDYNYLVFLYFATIITPALIMLAFYMHIYRVIVKQVRQIVTMNPIGEGSRRSSTAQIHRTSAGHGCHGGTMLRVLGAARKRDVKATQNLSIIVLFFMVCWIPLYTINCIKAFCPACDVHPKLTLFCIILSHLNSAVNPVLYAYHLRDFRAALKSLIFKMMGVEVEPRMEAIHRFSLASHNRLQSLDSSMRRSLQPRVYIDSPVWLRQQQALKKTQTLPKCGVLLPSIRNSSGPKHQTAAQVASVPANMAAGMWKIQEASSSIADRAVSHSSPSAPSDNANDNDGHAAKRCHRRSSTAVDILENLEYYEKDSYYDATADNNNAAGAYDDVFAQSPAGENTSGASEQSLRSAIRASIMREKLRSTDIEYQQRLHSSQCGLTDSSCSDRELSTPGSPTPVAAAAKSTRRELASGHGPPDFQTPKLVRSKSSSNASNAAMSIFFIGSSKPPPPARSGGGGKRSLSSSSSSPNKEAPTSHGNSNNYNLNSNSSSSSQSAHVADDNYAANIKNASGSHYYTIHHHHLFHQQQQLPEKFSPLRVMSSFIFPPTVKHSSLFQLFQPFSISAPSDDKAAPTAAAPHNAATATMKPQLSSSLEADESASTVAAEASAVTAVTTAGS